LFNRLNFNTSKAIILILCLIIAGGITYWQYSYFSSQGKTETAKVIVAAKNIKEGSKINLDMLTLKDAPVSNITKNMVFQEEDFENAYAKIDINEGTYLTKEMISQQPVPIIEDGMRRVTIRADMIMSLAGEIRAGDFVDIGLIKETKEKATEGAFKTEIIAEKVQIYSITNSEGANIEKLNSKSSNEYDTKQKIPAAITFVVTPDQAVLLKDSEAEGSIFLIGY